MTPVSWIATFDRVGRNHDVAPLELRCDDPDEMAFAIYNHVRRFLASSDIEVVVDLEDNPHATIFCGFNTGGSAALRKVGPS